MVTADGSMGSKSKPEKAFFTSFYIPFFHPKNQKMENARDIKSKSVKNRKE